MLVGPTFQSLFMTNLTSQGLTKLYKKSVYSHLQGSGLVIIHRFRVLQEDIDPHHRSHQYSLWQTENGMEALDWSCPENIWALMKSQL